jgi:CRISPR-associated protein Cas1
LSIFGKPPLDALVMVSCRWTPLYLEHGRLEVKDSGIQWSGHDGTTWQIPIAMVTSLILGPGTTVTHAAIKVCAESNTMICWTGEDGLRFYAVGSSPTHDNTNARKQVEAVSNPQRQTEVARRMFAKRFVGVDVDEHSVDTLRGMEGVRVRDLYREMGIRYGVAWKGRRYGPANWDVADEINRAISIANVSLYALVTAVVCSMGYLPQLGFIHLDGPLPFVYDIADIYKQETSLDAAFQSIGANANSTGKEILKAFRQKIEATRLLQRIPRDLEELMA